MKGFLLVDLLNIIDTAPPTTYSSSRTYALQTCVCAGNPSEWIGLGSDWDPNFIDCFDTVDGACPIAACATSCDSTPGYVTFMAESDNANDASFSGHVTPYMEHYGDQKLTMEERVLEVRPFLTPQCLVLDIFLQSVGSDIASR
jgi:hypothetical protein